MENNNSNTSNSSKTSCYTCSLVKETKENKLVVYKSSKIIVSHHVIYNPQQNRTGWFIAAPTRHICRFFELTENENTELNTIITAMDKALTVILGAKRVLIASLGWETLDHIHFHLVPIKSEPITYGYENFGLDTYMPLGASADSVCEEVKTYLKKNI